jgi:hypothetical protein
MEVKFQNSVTKFDHKEIQTKLKIKKPQRVEIKEEVTTIKLDLNKLKLSNEEENHKETMKRIKNKPGRNNGDYKTSCYDDNWNSIKKDKNKSK